MWGLRIMAPLYQAQKLSDIHSKLSLKLPHTGILERIPSYVVKSYSTVDQRKMWTIYTPHKAMHILSGRFANWEDRDEILRSAHFFTRILRDSKSVSCYLESEVFDFICQLTSTFWWNTAIHFLVQSSLYAHSTTPASEQLTENITNNLNIINKRFSPAVIESDRILFAGF